MCQINQTNGYQNAHQMPAHAQNFAIAGFAYLLSAGSYLSDLSDCYTIINLLTGSFYGLQGLNDLNNEGRLNNVIRPLTNLFQSVKESVFEYVDEQTEDMTPSRYHS